MLTKEVTKELWRLRINAVLTQLLAAIVYSINTSAYLSSCHRFVTNPRAENINGTSLIKIEPGLGESELFYSIVVGCIQLSSIIGGFLSAFLIKIIPYWYQYVFFICCNIFGYVLYGVANEGWVLLLGVNLAGMYLGAEVSLGFSYATVMSTQYVQTLKDRGETFECEKTKAIKVRNYLYALHTVGYSTGGLIGTAVGVLFSHLPIEQYQSIAWFNVACAIFALILFVALFRGESSCKKVNHYLTVPIQKFCCSESPITFGVLPIIIIISLLLLSFFEMFKWSYVDVLLNPVLSDSFGLTLSVSSYFYLGLSIPRIFSAFFVVLLQKIRLSSQFIMIIGLLMSITGYVLVCDWQAIPYDPCTEYSPFHHPQLFQNESITKTNKLNLPFSIYFDVELKTDYGNILSVTGPTLICQVDTSCQKCKENQGNYDDFNRLCLKFMDVDITNLVPNPSNVQGLLTLSCTFQQHQICMNIGQSNSVHHSKAQDIAMLVQNSDATLQSLMVLPEDIYTKASNSCINALDGQCHWIPFSTLTNSKCIDCPPICRGKRQRLLFVPFLLGMVLLVMSNPFMWVPTIALACNQTPKKMQEIVIGALNGANSIAQGFGPIIVDALYEGAQKRTFLPSVISASVHTLFLVEILVLYSKLGPKLNQDKNT